ncbi:hypothetical protein EV356DRAFT_531656 [Viridothelium virens]|uniref:Uncharacterized protein n=1 Tax=Viridothelium virens TaxID=1048519 RepID=A0A6A6HCH7_VIRVR|nr:hypothetical protein EV356DRAFT_531656 [Viridothelium virens]
MSIFSKKKKAAELEKKTQAESNKPKPAPYFHMPTHAARDFLCSTPSSFTGQHKAQIIEQHNRRSLMNRSTTDAAGRAPLSGTSTPIRRSSSQISSSSSMMADYPPVVTVHRTRPNPFLPASAQQSFTNVDDVPPMPTIPHRYSSPVIPKAENKVVPSQRPFSTSQKPTYVRSPLSTSNNSPIESEDASTASSTHSSIASQPPQLELRRTWDNGQVTSRTYSKPPIHRISETLPSLPPLSISEMPQHLEGLQSGTLGQGSTEGKREKKRKSLFGLGGRRSAVAAI